MNDEKGAETCPALGPGGGAALQNICETRASKLPGLLVTFLTLSRGWSLGRALHRRYGDMSVVRLFDANPDTPALDCLVATGVEPMRDIFAGSAGTFRSGNPILTPIVGQKSLFTLEEDEHARVRKLLTPSFSAAALRRYTPMFEEAAEQDVPQWPVGSPITALRHTQRVTLDIILRTMFGVSDPRRSATLRPLLDRIVQPNWAEGLWIYRPAIGRLGIARSYRRALAELHQRLAEEIEERRADPRRHERHDVLSRMVSASVEDDRLNNDELRDQLITLVVAGHETTSKALAWCLLDLAHHPDEQAKAQEAADRGDLDHLSSAFKESLRLHPVVANTGRRLARPARIGGRLVPAGWAVYPWISRPHFDERHFPNPCQFRPERFLGGTPDEIRAWQPFGGGFRRCIGAAFSILESAVILQSLLTRYHVLPARRGMEKPSSQFSVVVGPRNGGRVRLVPRTGGSAQACAPTPATRRGEDAHSRSKENPPTEDKSC
jgi:cytochrome P450